MRHQSWVHRWRCCARPLSGIRSPTNPHSFQPNHRCHLRVRVHRVGPTDSLFDPALNEMRSVAFSIVIYVHPKSFNNQLGNATQSLILEATTADLSSPLWQARRLQQSSLLRAFPFGRWTPPQFRPPTCEIDWGIDRGNILQGWHFAVLFLRLNTMDGGPR